MYGSTKEDYLRCGFDRHFNPSGPTLSSPLSLSLSLQDPEFQPDLVSSKSLAAAGLCSWVINIVRFYEVFCEVEPKRQALSKANSELATAQDKLAAIKSKINVSVVDGRRQAARRFLPCVPLFFLLRIFVASVRGMRRCDEWLTPNTNSAQRY